MRILRADLGFIFPATYTYKDGVSDELRIDSEWSSFMDRVWGEQLVELSKRVTISDELDIFQRSRRVERMEYWLEGGDTRKEFIGVDYRSVSSPIKSLAARELPRVGERVAHYWSLA